ncbi:type II toxin-antitoxin system VapC family toxin [Gemmatimonadota bacterium]
MSGSLITIDASALASVIFNESRSDAVWSAVQDRPLVAPSLLPYELANVAARKMQAYPEQHRLPEVVSLIDHLLVDYVTVPFSDMVTLSYESGLSSYDSAYLWVSMGLDIPLVTLDVKLSTAARRMGIEVIVPE